MKPILFLLCTVLGSASRADVILAVRDVRTGIGLSAQVVAESAGYAAAGFEVERRARVTLPAGAVRLWVRSEGHRVLAAAFEPIQDRDLEITFWLDPEVPDGPAETGALPGALCVCGTVVDGETLEPLGGVETEGGTTGGDGTFRFCLPVPDPQDEDALDTISTRFRKPGYADLTVDGILLKEGTVTLRPAMDPGEGARRAPDLHRFLLSQESAEEDGESGPEGPLAPLVPSTLSGLPVPLLTVIDPPDTIKVGMTCSCTTCTTVDVLSLESYVKRGLNDEWISSWDQDSLRSGAVAYRSYGSYYVLHPINGTFDICSSTCCQVNDTDTATATNTAADRTAGIVLQRSGAILRSEYSAENNAWDDPSDGLSCTNTDLSCGDGYAGSPATSWPCLADSVCATHGCFGHGRGMCQWGTQRWASTQAKLWNWIANHYYNAGGAGSGYRTAYMTSPFSATAASPSPASVAAGDTFTITLSATSYAGTAHTQVMIGASLYSVATGYISDAAHDTKVTLNPGANAVSRPFAVPAGTPAGTYDLITALWLDTDEDGAITAADLSLTSRTDAGAVTVTAAAGTCADPYAIGSFPYSDSRTTIGGATAIGSANCKSTRALAGPERVYRFTTVAQGSLTASITSAQDLDVMLMRACGAYDCEAWGDTGFTRDNLPPGTYYVVVDTAGTAGAYTLTLTFTAGDTLPPEAVDDLRLSKSGGNALLAWSAVALDIAGQSQAVDHYRVWRGAAPYALAPLASPTGTSRADAVLADGKNWYYLVQAVDAAGNGAAPCFSDVVDDPAAAFVGTWTKASSQPDLYGTAYKYVASAGSGSKTATYTPLLTCARPHRVYSWHPAASNRSPSVPAAVLTASGTTVVTVDQTADGGRWVSRGAFDLVPGSSYARISDAAPGGSVVIADAFRFAPAPATEFILDEQQSIRTGTWGTGGSTGGWEGDYVFTYESYAAAADYYPALELPGTYAVYTWYREGTNRSTAVPYTITTASGSSVVTVNQQINGQQWYLVGTFSLNPETARVRIGTPGAGSNVVIADAVRFVKQ